VARKTIWEIVKCNDNARQHLDQLHRQMASSSASIEAAREFLNIAPNGTGGLLVLVLLRKSIMASPRCYRPAEARAVSKVSVKAGEISNRMASRRALDSAAPNPASKLF
jgi:hypothetical protein